MMQKNVVIIFVKNPILGKVKTRLAASLGDAKALEVYQGLVQHTQQVTKNVLADKWVFYDDFIDEKDGWDNEVYQKSLQLPMVDLGQKMANAFWDMIQEGYEKISIIGSDCLELTQAIMEEAFQQLSPTQPAVIGQTHDGGYYLLGFDFSELIEENIPIVLNNVFLDKTWSHSLVAKEAIEALSQLQLKYSTLPKLNDVDEVKDLPEDFL